MMNERELNQLQLHSIAVYDYMVYSEILSNKARKVFQAYVKSMPPERKNPLYFYWSGIKVSCLQLKLMDKAKPFLHFDDTEYSEDEEFKALTFNQMLNIQKKHGILECFAFTIPSYNQRQCEYTFVDCCKKLICMRNKLAHERSSLSFKDADIIEILSTSKLEEHVHKQYGSLSVDNMTDETKAIFSNLIIMQAVIERLDVCEENENNESVD